MRIFVLFGLALLVLLFSSVPSANGRPSASVTATATSIPTLIDMKTVLITASNAAQIKEVADIKGLNGAVYTAAFSPDGQILALGGEADTIRLMDVKTMQDLPPLIGQKPS